MTKKSARPDGIYEAPEPVVDLEADLDDEVDLIDVILTKHAVSVSEFKKNPNAVVGQMHRRGMGAMAVMTNNKATFYVVLPERLDDLLDVAWASANKPQWDADVAEALADPTLLIEAPEVDAEVARLIRSPLHAGGSQAVGVPG